MERDYEYDSKTFFKDLGNPEEMGKIAGERAVRALNPQKPATKKIPVIFDHRISGGLIGSLAGAISGSAVARGTTILKDKMGQKVFSDGITITDDPFMKRGMRSHPFDGEGITPQKRNLIENGVLTGWVLDLRSARQLGLKSTGNANRGTGSPPSPGVANFYMHAGKLSVQDLIKDIDEGFFITRFLGSGGNILTGDYSRGAQGFWIEKGQITYAISEATVAGNLADMWMSATPANDLQFKYGVDAPSLRIDGMTVAGA
jgi:PmbA protein